MSVCVFKRLDVYNLMVFGARLYQALDLFHFFLFFCFSLLFIVRLCQPNRQTNPTAYQKHLNTLQITHAICKYLESERKKIIKQIERTNAYIILIIHHFQTIWDLEKYFT